MLPFPLGEREVATFACVLVRAAAWAYTAPIVGDRFVPARMRMVVASLIALAIAPARPSIEATALFTHLPIELAYGLILGFTSRLAIFGAEAGGQLIGIQLGLGFAGTYDADARDESIATRKIAFFLASLAFLQAGGLENAVRALSLPIAPDGDLRAPLMVVIEEAPNVLVHAVRIAAPMLLATFVGNIVMALASRAAPALNVFSVMLALSLIVGGIVLIVTAPDFAREMYTAGGRSARAVEEVFAR
jgi:flagellar biosynthesis protein FliR